MGHPLERPAIEPQDLVADDETRPVGARAGHDCIDVDDARLLVDGDLDSQPDDLARQIVVERGQLGGRKQLVPFAVADPQKEPGGGRLPDALVADLVVDVLLAQQLARLGEGLVAVAEPFVGGRGQRGGEAEQQDDASYRPRATDQGRVAAELPRQRHRNARFSGVVRAVSTVPLAAGTTSGSCGCGALTAGGGAGRSER